MAKIVKLTEHQLQMVMENQLTTEYHFHQDEPGDDNTTEIDPENTLSESMVITKAQLINALKKTLNDKK